MAKQLERETALSLRSKGMSIGEISRHLHVSKGTVSLWCRDIALSRAQIDAIAERSHHHATAKLLLAAEKRRLQREIDSRKVAEIGRKDVGELSKRDIFMVGLGLYWGEGYKQGSQELGFTNSNPAIIMFYLDWLEKIYDVRRMDLILRVSINTDHAYRIQEVQQYWSKLTSVPLSQFTKPSLIKTAIAKRYTNHQQHFGTLRIKVRKGTNTRRRVLGSISAFSQN
jgi:hypothetical protein